MIPESLKNALRPITVVAGHYGVGKTNFACNLAIDLHGEGRQVTVIDLDIVNPYFRASEQRTVLEAQGVGLIAPVFAEAGSSLDVPSLTGHITPALQDARDGRYVIVDAGGDDAGVAALGRFSRTITAGDYAMLYVANRFRNLVSEPADALENMREIEAASRLRCSAVVNNAHLKEATTADSLVQGIRYAEQVSQLAGLPLVCTTVPEGFDDRNITDAYHVRQIVRTPWE